MSLRFRFETQHVPSPPTGWASGTVPIAPAVPGHRYALYSVILSSSAAAQCNFANSDGTAIGGQIFLIANSTLVLAIQDNADPWYETAENMGLSLVVTAGPVYGDVYYNVVPNTIRAV